MPEYTCPHCQMPIYDDEALLCHFCGESLHRSTSRGVLGKMKYANPRIIGILVILLAVAAFALLYIF